MAKGRALVTALVALAVVAVGVVGWTTSRDLPETTTTTAATSLATRRYTSDDPLRVLLLGDSLAWEAQGPFTEAVQTGGRAVARTMAFGGTNWCTFYEELPRVVRADRPEVVVVQFSGNNFGPCMAEPATGRPLTGDALVEKYRRDAERTTRFLLDQGATVYLVSSPAFREGHLESAALGEVVEELASSHPSVRFLDAAAAVEQPGGGYTDFLPCRGQEPCTERDPDTGRPAARVRAADGVHFCPGGLPAVAGVTLACSTWSSGAWRYGTTMAEAVIRDFDLRR